MKATRWLASYAIFAALVAECLVLAFATDAFFTESNLANVVRQNAFTAILAAGMRLVILTGGIDLSTGSAVGLSGARRAESLVRCAPPPAHSAEGLRISLAAGATN